MRQLKILWDGRKVGSYVCLDDGTEMFSYDAEYLASINARAISHSLPLRRDPYGQRQLRPFFAGLLPEDAQRQRIATYLGSVGSLAQICARTKYLAIGPCASH
ncbi:MAG: HipA N-terminal domain-containing protein [Kiritimatiellae bacterium]|nr:HipA N-terminal domain-containing protein [Kiritimatiellia bacterium]